ncbi:hypothetical protein L210DRAFT_3388459 [Boletus edulis BED1]|uniref:ZW10 C-terminal helical domain-containing protein n=1 Tax=Boletus edulis BED1 TaxID=1328754 RepID=A0AAD4C5K1_BOLED|nr:hypothetical protein L210DRAFT_3388459 [Boletus edulis BED1]
MTPSHLPRQVDVSSQILSKLDSVTFQSLDSAVASSWRAGLDESIHLTKKRIHDRIHANLPAFEAQLASARSAQQRLQGLTSDVDALNHAVLDPETGLTPILLAALRKHQALAQAFLNADVLHASLSHLSECKIQLEKVQHLMDSGDLPAAVPASARLAQLLDSTPPPLGEATITSDIRSKLRVLTNRLEELLNNAYTQGLVVSSTDVIIRPFVPVPNAQKPIPLSAILSSLSSSSLSAHMASLRRDITTHYIDHTLIHPTSLSFSQEPDQFGSFIHRLQRLPSSTKDDSRPLSNLSRILEFMNDTLFPCLPQSQREIFPRSLAKPLTTSIMTRLLIPSLPLKLDSLPAFLELTGASVDFETKYVVGLLKGDTFEREIKSWVDNVCAHYERGRRQRILDDVRRIILASVSRPKDTFSAELVTVIEVTQPSVEPTPVVAPVAADGWNPNGDYTLKTDPSGSVVDAEDAWGFDDDDEESQEEPASKPEPLEEPEPDPNEAWGWNDELAEEQPETSTRISAAITPDEPSEQDEVWDDDPWADDSIANKLDHASVTPSVVAPPQPAPAASASSSRHQPLSNGHPSTNGHVANGHHPPSKSLQNASIVNKEPYPVSVLIRRIAQAVEDALHEGKALASSGIFSKFTFPTSTPGTLIMQSGALVLDLYRALYPVMAASRMSKPAGRMQFSNDCSYLSEEMGRMLKREQGLSDVRERLEECKDDLKVLADSWFYKGIDEQMTALEDVLADADGFVDTSDQERYDECEMVITRVLRDVRSTAHAWKPMLPKSKYYTAVGLVVDGVLSRILDSILVISDIPEVESRKLSELCRILTALEGLFVENTSESSFVVSYVPSWLKFSYLSELLEASMADLTYLFEEGALVDFEIDELVMLVKALFADTPLRTKTLDKIMNGHPVR